ncbi:MAG TPA: tagaturonate epimerase family protein [Terriglobia bacterium]|nr:tagaturonate epimerase family protein [Terriglobia bacterium]
MNASETAPPLAEAQSLAAEIGRLSGVEVYPLSITAIQHSLLFLGRRDGKKFLGALSADPSVSGRFSGQKRSVTLDNKPFTLTLAETSASTAGALRALAPFLAARPLGLQKSVGCGDRLGLATPGHVRAVRGSGIAPIFAQQSMRENARTGRTPQEVMDDAMWGVFQEGWREGFGADADHLKTTADVDICAAAGYTFYTVDPGEYVDNSANTDSEAMLRQKVEGLPWNVLEGSARDLQNQLAAKPLDLGAFKLTITQEELLRAAAKYGRAVAHTVKMYRHLQAVMNHRPFELEMSVDETETISTLAEHVYIAHELKRLGVTVVSLAPRYVGDFEKGVDYIGDLRKFEESFARHLDVSKTFGPYKLSLHSGSDKFSIYPIAARVAGDLVHLKTAGTSYLEALRAIAVLNPKLFREIVPFAIERYSTDRASYHVSADATKMPAIRSLRDDQLTALLDDFHAREVLHVTFGSVINDSRFREPFFATLRGKEETYYQIIERHFNKHLAPFRKTSAARDSAGN